MQHIFDTDIATKLGINEAIVLGGITSLIKLNIKNPKFYHGHRCWTRGSIDYLLLFFPYLTKYKIRSAIKSLVDNQILLVDKLNLDPCDQTKWYTLNSGESHV